MQIVKTIDEVRKTVKAWKKEGLGWSCPYNGLSSRRT